MQETCKTISEVLTYAKFESQRERGEKMRWNRYLNKSQQIIF